MVKATTTIVITINGKLDENPNSWNIYKKEYKKQKKQTQQNIL